MRIISTTDSRPTDTLDSLALYSGMDCLSLYEIKDGLEPLLDQHRRAVYEFEMELQSPLLAMSLAGLPVDQEARREMVRVFSATQTALAALINDLLDTIGYFDYYQNMTALEFSQHTSHPLPLLPRTWEEWTALPLPTRRAIKLEAGDALAPYHKALKEYSSPFNPNSPPQKLRLFYHFFGSPKNTAAASYYLPPPWLVTYGIAEYKSRNTKNEYTPAADREALEKIIKASSSGPRYAAFWAAPFAHICLELADLSKSLGFLNCRLENGYFKASFGAVTDTGRLSSRANAQGFASNAQNVTPKLRHIFVSPPGEKFIAIDYGQIESRIVAAICFRLFGATNYLAMCECGDTHTLCSSMVWDNLPWPEDFTLDWTIKHGPFPKDMLRAAKAIAGVKFYRGKSYRDVSKTLGHGSNYMGKPPTMSKHSHIEVPLIEHYQSVYFSMCPELPRWHRWVVEQVQTVGEITTMLGRTRRFFARPNDDSTIRKAVAYEPQSVAADYCNRALLRLHKLALVGEFPAIIRLSKHDELAVTFKEPLENQVLSMMVAQMEEHITLTAPNGTTRDWFVPVEAESGWNLGRQSQSNPDGLSHPDSTRVRTPAVHWHDWKL